MYIVKVYFEDLQDNGHKYNPGDVYPREGYIPTKTRIVELMTAANRRRMPLISLPDTDIGMNKPEMNQAQIEAVAELSEPSEKPKRKRKE